MKEESIRIDELNKTNKQTRRKRLLSTKQNNNKQQRERRKTSAIFIKYGGGVHE